MRYMIGSLIFLAIVLLPGCGNSVPAVLESVTITASPLPDPIASPAPEIGRCYDDGVQVFDGTVTNVSYDCDHDSYTFISGGKQVTVHGYCTFSPEAQS